MKFKLMVIFGAVLQTVFLYLCLDGLHKQLSEFIRKQKIENEVSGSLAALSGKGIAKIGLSTMRIESHLAEKQQAEENQA